MLSNIKGQPLRIPKRKKCLCCFWSTIKRQKPNSQTKLAAHDIYHSSHIKEDMLQPNKSLPSSINTPSLSGSSKSECKQCNAYRHVSNV